jgi:hypothetical protein
MHTRWRTPIVMHGPDRELLIQWHVSPRSPSRRHVRWREVCPRRHTTHHVRWRWHVSLLHGWWEEAASRTRNVRRLIHAVRGRRHVHFQPIQIHTPGAKCFDLALLAVWGHGRWGLPGFVSSTPARRTTAHGGGRATSAWRPHTIRRATTHVIRGATTHMIR